MTDTPVAPRVIIVDDSADVRARVTRLLLDAECRVVGEAATAGEALHLLSAVRPDVVVLDLGLPGSGFTVLRAVAQRRVPPVVIVLTQHAERGYRERCLALGAAAVLDKSFEFATLATVLRGLLDGERGIEAAR